MSTNPSKFETLPNEILLNIFEYLSLKDLYHAFSRLNLRLNKLLRSIRNLCLNLEQSDPLLITLFTHQIIRLVVNTSNDIDLKRFPNLQSLTLHEATNAQLRQIRFDLVPRLVHLSISSKFQYESLIQLAQDIFSNRFPALRYVHLSRFNGSFEHNWSVSPNLTSVCIQYINSMMIPLILTSCSNLYRLKVNMLSESYNMSLPPTSCNNHPLKRFSFCDSYNSSIFSYIDSLFSCTTHIEWLYMEFYCDITPIHLMRTIADRLIHLRQFHCHIIAPINTELEQIRQIHPCFHRVHWMNNDSSSRIFTTK